MIQNSLYHTILLHKNIDIYVFADVYLDECDVVNAGNIRRVPKLRRHPVVCPVGYLYVYHTTLF